MENGNFLFLLQTEDGSLFSLVGKWSMVIDVQPTLLYSTVYIFRREYINTSKMSPARLCQESGIGICQTKWQMFEASRVASYY
jgi:hypothetical protein